MNAPASRRSPRASSLGTPPVVWRTCRPAEDVNPPVLPNLAYFLDVACGAGQGRCH